MLRFILALICLLPLTAFAQTPTGTPENLALQAKLMQELQSNLQCTAKFIELQQKEAKLSEDLKKAEARIKELEGSTLKKK